MDRLLGVGDDVRVFVDGVRAKAKVVAINVTLGGTGVQREGTLKIESIDTSWHKQVTSFLLKNVYEQPFRAPFPDAFADRDAPWASSC